MAVVGPIWPGIVLDASHTVRYNAKQSHHRVTAPVAKIPTLLGLTMMFALPYNMGEVMSRHVLLHGPFALVRRMVVRGWAE